MRRQFAILVSMLAVVVASCTDQRSPTTPGRRLLAAISDGAHSGGNPDFFFLPPLVASPVSNPNFKPGTFNPHLLPVVRVFLLPTAGAAGCSLLGTPVYGPVAATLDAGGEQYQVNWDTRASNLADGAYYRLCVFSSPTGQELGFLDVAPVAGGMKKLATNDTYAFQDGRTLPIKVRIQQGALCANPQDCTEFTVSTAGGDFTVPSKFAGLSVPAGAVRPGDVVTVVVEKETPQFTGECLPTDIVQSKGCYHFRSEPDLYQFAILVRMEACVDVQFLDEGQVAALRLFKFNTTQGLVELPQATPTLIDCTNFIALANPAASPPTSFAAAALRGLGRWAGRLLSPPPLYASMPGGVPTGLGGSGGSFSDVGGAVPSTATQAPDTVHVPTGGTVGQTGLAATASGGSGTGAFSFTSLTTSVCTVDATSGSLALLTAGTCTLTATKAADSIYKAATSAPGSFPVAGLPDLVVSSINLQNPQVSPGSPINYTYTISNIGGEGPTGNSTFDVAAYLSSDAVLDAGDLELGGGYSVWQYHLSVGWSHSLTVSNVVIPNTVPPGSYYLIVVADAKPGLPPNFYPGVTEANESNNWRAVPITVTAGVPLFGVNSGDDGLSIIDPLTGHVTFVGKLSPDPAAFTTPVEMVVGPDGKLWAWNNSGTGGVGFVTVDKCTGLGTYVGNLGINSPDFTVGPGGLLYYVFATQLRTLDMSSGITTTVGDMGLTPYEVAYDPNSQKIVGITDESYTSPWRLVLIDPVSAVATLGPVLDKATGWPGALTVSPSGQLLATGFGGPLGNSILFSIDVATGAVQNVRTLTATAPQGLAFAPACSTP